jgi:hypothetical protein
MRVMMAGMSAFAQKAWIIDGPHVRDFGVLFPTHHCIEGPGSHLVVATPRYVRQLVAWHALFPKAQL